MTVTFREGACVSLHWLWSQWPIQLRGDAAAGQKSGWTPQGPATWRFLSFHHAPSWLADSPCNRLHPSGWLPTQGYKASKFQPQSCLRFAMLNGVCITIPVWIYYKRYWLSNFSVELFGNHTAIAHLACITLFIDSIISCMFWLYKWKSTLEWQYEIYMEGYCNMNRTVVTLIHLISIYVLSYIHNKGCNKI